MGNEKRNRQKAAVKKHKGISYAQRVENMDRLSVIISVQQDEKTIQRLLYQVGRLSPKETILVIHGSKDRSIDIILNNSSCASTCYIYPFPLGEELWRSVGAKEATGDVWLFLQAGEVIAAEDMLPFIQACYQGVDIALRKRQTMNGSWTVSLARAYVNSLFEKERLGTSSMSDLPYAMTQRASVEIGVDHLFVPPLAQAIALRKGLRVEAVHLLTGTVRGIRASRERERTCLGDHLEAVAYWTEQHRDGH